MHMATERRPVIVYVEDNTGDSQLLREAFIEQGHEVELLVFEHGERALHYFQVKAKARNLPPPHSILLDAHLPMVTGIELIKFIRSSDAFEHTPVFIFANAAAYADVSSAVEISPDSFLKKPDEWEQFCLLADTLMRGARVAESKSISKPETVVCPPAALKVL
jgi:DNA-binding response OmpR family regulator